MPAAERGGPSSRSSSAYSPSRAGRSARDLDPPARVAAAHAHDAAGLARAAGDFRGGRRGDGAGAVRERELHLVAARAARADEEHGFDLLSLGQLAHKHAAKR